MVQIGGDGTSRGGEQKSWDVLSIETAGFPDGYRCGLWGEWSAQDDCEVCLAWATRKKEGPFTEMEKTREGAGNQKYGFRHIQLETLNRHPSGDVD